jgi:hypothetical protein
MHGSTSQLDALLFLVPLAILFPKRQSFWAVGFFELP